MLLDVLSALVVMYSLQRHGTDLKFFFTTEARRAQRVIENLVLLGVLSALVVMYSLYNKTLFI